MGIQVHALRQQENTVQQNCFYEACPRSIRFSWGAPHDSSFSRLHSYTVMQSVLSITVFTGSQRHPTRLADINYVDLFPPLSIPTHQNLTNYRAWYSQGPLIGQHSRGLRTRTHTSHCTQRNSRCSLPPRHLAHKHFLCVQNSTLKTHTSSAHWISLVISLAPPQHTTLCMSTFSYSQLIAHLLFAGSSS